MSIHDMRVLFMVFSGKKFQQSYLLMRKLRIKRHSQEHISQQVEISGYQFLSPISQRHLRINRRENKDNKTKKKKVGYKKEKEEEYCLP